MRVPLLFNSGPPTVKAMQRPSWRTTVHAMVAPFLMWLEVSASPSYLNWRRSRRGCWHISLPAGALLVCFGDVLSGLCVGHLVIDFLGLLAVVAATCLLHRGSLKPDLLLATVAASWLVATVTMEGRSGVVRPFAAGELTSPLLPLLLLLLAGANGPMVCFTALVLMMVDLFVRNVWQPQGQEWSWCWFSWAQFFSAAALYDWSQAHTCRAHETEQRLLEHGFSGFFVLDLRSERILSACAKMEELLESTPLCGQRFRDFLRPEDARGFQQLIQNVANLDFSPVLVGCIAQAAGGHGFDARLMPFSYSRCGQTMGVCFQMAGEPYPSKRTPPPILRQSELNRHGTSHGSRSGSAAGSAHGSRPGSRPGSAGVSRPASTLGSAGDIESDGAFQWDRLAASLHSKSSSGLSGSELASEESFTFTQGVESLAYSVGTSTLSSTLSGPPALAPGHRQHFQRLAGNSRTQFPPEVPVPKADEFPLCRNNIEASTQTMGHRRLPPAVPGTSSTGSSSSSSHVKKLKPTPLDSCSYTLVRLMRHWNSECTTGSCCRWHSALRTARIALKAVEDKDGHRCNHDWHLLLQGWQCHRCKTLNNNDGSTCTWCDTRRHDRSCTPPRCKGRTAAASAHTAAATAAATALPNSDSERNAHIMSL